MIHNHNYYFKIIGFDCCYMSTIEVLYELHPYCDIILACESASPDDGFNSQTMINSFSNHTDPIIISRHIAADFIHRNQSTKSSETDVCILSTKYVENFILLLNQIHLQSSDIKKNNKLVAEDNTYPTYDLLATIRTSHISPSIKTKIENLWPKIVLFYAQNIFLKKRKEATQFNGLAFTPCPMVDEEGLTYKDLSIKTRLVIC